MSMLCVAGESDLLWDYTLSAPQSNPDNGLFYGSKVDDAADTRNGLKGIKLNSSGWCSFTKAPVSGLLKLTFGPRSGLNSASLQIHTWSGNQPSEEKLIAITCEVRALRTQTIPLTAEQNNIYISRLLNTETVLQKIEFMAGATEDVEPCAEDDVVAQEVRIDTLSERALFFLNALKEANRSGNKTIYLPNGVYDLGGLTLTALEANHIAIIGESMEGVIIRNAPDYRMESIDKSATIRIAPDVEGTYLQNLTIENALDYYKDDNGRAVALWDQGTKTICRRVRLLSHQDTYYSDRPGGLKYFEDCEIHGTVDFICGDGNVYFKNTLLYCEKRSKNGSGTDVLTANAAAENDRGYVFEGCTIKSECPIVSLGRSWKNSPRCVFLNTLLDYSAGNFNLSDGKKIQRWTIEGMSVLPDRFGEYRTKDIYGKVISPKANKTVFTYKGEQKMMNTIIGRREVSRYNMIEILGPWANEIPKIIFKNYKQ